MIRHKTLAYVHADLRRTLTGSGIEAERQRGREAERQRGREGSEAEREGVRRSHTDVSQFDAV